jgi:DNA-binding response OmpR family regulator
VTRREKVVAGKTKSSGIDVASRSTTHRTIRVLLVDTDPSLGDVLKQCAPSGDPVQFAYARSLTEARAYLTEKSVDLAVINPALPDGNGMDLAEELNKSRRVTSTILVGEQPSVESAMKAIRVGASDYIVKPLDNKDASERVLKVLAKQRKTRDQSQRVRRLRRLCKKLNQARVDVSKQVDLLCNDLVTAYQELAGQMQQVVQATEYGAVIRDELDLEHLLRKTLEHLVEKAGATNAAVFLPSSMDEYTLGGYVNYDCSPEQSDMLLQHLADVVAPKISHRDDIVHITDNQSLSHLLGGDAVYLVDSHMLSFACRSENESLAVITLFRDGADPFDQAVLDTAEAIGPLLGEALARVIRIHHRGLDDDLYEDGYFGPPEDEDDDTLPF